MSYYITIEKFTCDPLDIDERLELGDGVDLTDPENPKKSEYSPFKSEQEEEAVTKVPKVGVKESKDIVLQNCVIKEELKFEEEIDIINQFFRASFLSLGADQSYKSVKSQRDEFHTIYALLEMSGPTSNLLPTEKNWKRNPEQELVYDTPKKNKDIFLMRYGSHFVSAIQFGLRIGIQAQVKKSEIKSFSEFSASFKGAYGSFSADAGASTKHEKKLKQMNVKVNFRSRTGGRVDGGMTAAYDIEGVRNLLNEINEGKAKFMVCPIQVILRSYLPTLRREWTNTQQVIAPEDQKYKVPDAQYGVPKGTIIPWYPNGEYIMELDSKEKKVKIVPPDGWAICDGSKETPDLRDKFIRGTSEKVLIATRHGSEKHSHHGKTEYVPRGSHINAPKVKEYAHATAHISHTHDFTTEDSEHIPPFIYLTFIMKL